MMSNQSADGLLSFQTRQMDGVMVVELDGEMDLESSQNLLEYVGSTIGPEHRRIVLDCGRLRFLSSTGISVLLRLKGQLRKWGGDVKLANVRGPVVRMLRIMRLGKVLGLHDDVPSACAAFYGDMWL
jgi:anti-anti-sigma factor